MSEGRFLVTGGSGFIGSALVRRMIMQGKNVRVLDNGTRGSIRRLTDIRNEFEFIEGDIRNYSVVEKAIRGCSSVIHLAYINGTENFYRFPLDVLEVAVQGITNVLNASASLGVEEIYLASSSEVYQAPRVIPTPEQVELVVPDVQNARYSYGLGKIVQEFTLTHSSHLFKKSIVFRPHNIYGPDMGFKHVIPELTHRIYNSDSRIVELKGDGNQRRSFCYIDDFVTGLLILIDNPKSTGIYNIGSGFETRIIDLAELIAKTLGKKVDFYPGLAPIGEAIRRIPDLTKIQNLGYEASTDLKAGLEKFCSWYIDEGLKLDEHSREI